MESHLFLILLLLALAFANGTNDVSKGIATLVGGGITNYRAAMTWGTLWTVVGALGAGLVATEMVKTFSTGLIEPGFTMPATLGHAVVLGTTIWVLIASRTGLPVSTTHALTGAIIGAGLVAFGGQGVTWTALGKKVALPLLLSPLLALAASALIHRVLRRVAGQWEGTCLCVLPASRALVRLDANGRTSTLFQATLFSQPLVAVPAECSRASLRGVTIGLDSIHWLSSGLASLARGTNDAPKIIAMLVLVNTTPPLADSHDQLMAYIGVACAMGLGSYLGGLGVTEVLAEKIARMNHVEGLSANLTTSTLVLTSAVLGLPVSTTHVSSSAIIGIGVLRGFHDIRWSTVIDMILAWFVTLPVSGLLASLAFWLLAQWHS